MKSFTVLICVAALFGFTGCKGAGATKDNPIKANVEKARSKDMKWVLASGYVYHKGFARSKSKWGYLCTEKLKFSDDSCMRCDAVLSKSHGGEAKLLGKVFRYGGGQVELKECEVQ